MLISQYQISNTEWFKIYLEKNRLFSMLYKMIEIYIWIKKIYMENISDIHWNITGASKFNL